MGASVAKLSTPTSRVIGPIAAIQEEVAYWRKENDRKAKIIDKYLDS